MDNQQKKSLFSGSALSAVAMALLIFLFFKDILPIWITTLLAVAWLAVTVMLVLGVVKKVDSLYRFALTCFFLGIIALAIMVIVDWKRIIAQFTVDGEFDAKKLADYIGDSNASAIIFVSLSFLQVTFLPIPSTVTTVAGVLLFGGGKGFLLSLIGQVAGSMFAFFLGKKFGTKLIKWIIGVEMFEKYHLFIKGRDKVILIFMFLFPFFPDDVLCLFAGITTFTYPAFLIIMLISRSITIGYTTLGVGIMSKFTSLGVWTYVIYGVLALLIIVLLIYIWKYGDKIEIGMLRFINKVMPKGLRKSMISEADIQMFEQHTKKSNAVQDKADKDNLAKQSSVSVQAKADTEKPIVAAENTIKKE